MPDYTVSSVDVTNGFDTSMPTSEIDMLIAVADDADECMEKNEISDQRGKIMKIYAVRSLISGSENSGRGQVMSERSASGASRSFGSGGVGEVTKFSSQLKTLDVHGCFSAIVGEQTGLGFRSIGPRD